MRATQVVYVWGLPSQRGFPYMSLHLDEPVTTTDTIAYDGRMWEVYQADEVTHENQLQNVYVRLKPSTPGT